MESEKVNRLYFSDVDQPITLDRRDFIKKLGSGIIIIFSLGELSFLQGCADAENFNAFLRVKEDGRVNCYTGKIEMGQGVITSLAMVLAEELEVPVNSVDMIMGDTDLCPYDAGTWGSLTTRFADPVLRAAAAEAREVLKELAADHFSVSVEELKADSGTIFIESDTDRKISYAELTKGKKIVRSLRSKPKIKRSKDFKVVGKPFISIDAKAKVTGKAMYAGDIRLPNMVYASMVRPLAHGSKKLSVEASALSNFEGVELVEDGNLVAVVHADPAIAEKAAKKVKVNWQQPDSKVNSDSVFKYFYDNIQSFKTSEKDGNLEQGKTESNISVNSNYYDGYKAHAPIETHTSTCYFEGNHLHMWVSSQTPFGTRKELSKSLNLPLENIHIKQIFLGGGFGGKIYNQQAIEAAKISRKISKPVQLAWTRAEEFKYDRFRPAALMKINAGVDQKGKLTLWEFDIYCAGTRGTKLFYNIPNNRTRFYNDEDIHPFGIGAWRAPGNNTTTFARESHIDVLANSAGMDPLEFRLMNMKDANMTATLKLAAETFGWNRTKAEGRGYGIALGVDAGTLVATIAEVHVDESSGKVQPIKIVCAQDMGQVVNPHGARVQTEGGITMGLGYALSEDIVFDGGNVKTKNFNRYEITRFSTTPKIECVFIDKMDAKPQGGGEPAIITVGGAIANAVFDACGARVNQMPITSERILNAMKN